MLWRNFCQKASVDTTNWFLSNRPPISLTFTGGLRILYGFSLEVGIRGPPLHRENSVITETSKALRYKLQSVTILFVMLN